MKLQKDGAIFVGLLVTVLAIGLSIAYVEMKRTGVFN
jgi:hypothetical protein